MKTGADGGSPSSTRGNGILDSTDTVQTRRYVSGLDAPQAPGGPTAPISAPKIDETLIGDMWRYLFGSQISVEDATVEADKRVSIIIDPAGAAAGEFHPKL
ncbi:MAG: hypothetical protein IPO41_05585 [Acidobacteria bacterium]|nr:hypothetical protein [Acidobacteriota bacterium]